MDYVPEFESLVKGDWAGVFLQHVRGRVHYDGGSSMGVLPMWAKHGQDARAIETVVD
jgi:hypothetical protein